MWKNVEKCGKYDIFLFIYTNKNMLNIGDASKLLGVSKRTLRNWESDGKIKSIRTPGNHRRYDKEELLKIMIIK